MRMSTPYLPLVNDSLSTVTATTQFNPIAELYDFYFVLNGIVGVTVCSIGILGNIVNVVIQTTTLRRNPSSTTMFLLALAVTDILVLLIHMVYDIVCNTYPTRPIVGLSDVAGMEGTFTYFVFFTWHMPANIFTVISNWLIVSVMTFRFIAVYFPLKAKEWCSVTRAKWFISIIVVLSTLLMLPEFFTVEIEKSDEAGFIINDTQLYYDHMFNKVYYGIVEALNSVIPFIVCTLLSYLLIRTLNREDTTLSMRERYKRRVDQRRISLMLLAITFWFILCTFPSFICRLIKQVSVKKALSKDWVMFLGISNLLILLNHTANFILYAVTSRAYRQQCVNLVLCRSRKSLDRQQSIAHSITMRNVKGGSSARALQPESQCQYESIPVADV